MFDLRLTHEEVVEAQAAFLQTAEELDVVGREIARLEQITAEGAVAGKTLLERKYEQRKLEALLRSQRQRLLLHGLSPSQVDAILAKRTLLSEMTVFVPGQSDAAPLLQVEQLKVDKGQHVKAGDLLCVLADYSALYIQGKAFEQDVPALDRAANRDWRVTAVVRSNDPQPQTVPDLKILSLANTVEPESRAFLFFVELPNKLIRDRRTPDGRRYCAWRFKPGQRLELLVPVERWSDRLVLPREAVVQDGAESYVFEKNNGHFDRRAVRIEYRDQYSAVLANDGAIRARQDGRRGRRLSDPSSHEEQGRRRQTRTPDTITKQCSTPSSAFRCNIACWSSRWRCWRSATAAGSYSTCRSTCFPTSTVRG